MYPCALSHGQHRRRPRRSRLPSPPALALKILLPPSAAAAALSRVRRPPPRGITLTRRRRRRLRRRRRRRSSRRCRRGPNGWRRRRPARRRRRRRRPAARRRRRTGWSLRRRRGCSSPPPWGVRRASGPAYPGRLGRGFWRAPGLPVRVIRARADATWRTCGYRDRRRWAGACRRRRRLSGGGQLGESLRAGRPGRGRQLEPVGVRGVRLGGSGERRDAGHFAESDFKLDAAARQLSS
jgi:hypothetical protein